ncbi:hypothetical protein K488DRAFT_16408, partial [Vararia minispora EC-137]
VLGGASTLAASYLAKARSSGEPETSAARAKVLEHFLREVRAYVLDHGHENGDGLVGEHGRAVRAFRAELELLLG